MILSFILKQKTHSNIRKCLSSFWDKKPKLKHNILNNTYKYNIQFCYQ